MVSVSKFISTLQESMDTKTIPVPNMLTNDPDRAHESLRPLDQPTLKLMVSASKLLKNI